MEEYVKRAEPVDNEGAFVGGGEAGSRSDLVESLRCFLNEKDSDYRRVRGVYKIGKTRVIDFAYELMDDERKPVRWPDKSRPYLRYGELGPEWFLTVVEQETGKSISPMFNNSSLELQDFVDYSRWTLGVLRESLRLQERTGQNIGLLCLPVDRIKDAAIVADIFFSPGYWKDWSWKVILEERLDCGVVSWEVPKPEIDRVLPVGPLNWVEAREFVRGTLERRAYGHGEGGEVIAEELIEAIVSLAGRHPKVLLLVCDVVASGLETSGTSLKGVGQKIDEIREIVVDLVALLRPREVEETIDLINSSLEREGRESFDGLMSGQYEIASMSAVKITRQGEKELDLAGLLAEDGNLIPVTQAYRGRARIKRLWAECLGATEPSEKGRALEGFVAEFLRQIPGFGVRQAGVNLKTKSEEIDVSVRVNGSPMYGELVICECKNWASAVGGEPLAYFLEKVRRRNCRVGIFVALNGVLPAFRKQLESYLKDGITIALLERSDFARLDDNVDPETILRDSYYRTREYVGEEP